MKAKLISKIKSQMRDYLVLKTHGMFGDFQDYNGKDYPLSFFEEIKARNPKEAAFRYFKRIHKLNDFSRYDQTPEETNETFGKVKVLPKDKPFERFITYWG